MDDDSVILNIVNISDGRTKKRVRGGMRLME